MKLKMKLATLLDVVSQQRKDIAP